MVKTVCLGFILAILSACLTGRGLTSYDPDLHAGQVAVINETSEIQEFFIGEDSENLYEVTVNPGDKWISPVFTGRPHIRIYDGEKFDEYLLMPGLPYRLYWDKKKNRPDIRMFIYRSG